MTDNVIILEVIRERASDAQVTQLCSSLTTSYFNQLVQANTPCTFDWGPTGTEITDPVKITVGSVEYLLVYDSAIGKVKLIGTCDSGEWANFSASGQTLSYNNGSLQFTTQCQLNGGSSIEITVEATSATAVNAKS